MGRTLEAKSDFQAALEALPGVRPKIRHFLASEIDITRDQIEKNTSGTSPFEIEVRASPGLDALLSSLDAEADLEFHRGDPEAAGRKLELAIDELDQQRARVAPGEYRASFIDQARPLYERMVALQLNLGQPDRALEILESFRARTLLDRLHELSGGDNEEARSAAPLDRTQLCRRLPPRTLLVVYDVVDGRLVTWLVKQSGIEIVSTRLP
jgi:hypothetical protein